MRNRTVLVVLICLALAACGPKNVRAPIVGGMTTEQIARGVFEDLGTFIGAAQKNHPECSADKPTAGQGICPALHSAIEVQRKMGKGINIYCSGVPLAGNEPYGQDLNGDGKGGPCSPVLGAKPELQSILAEALNLLAQYGGGGL